MEVSPKFILLCYWLPILAEMIGTVVGTKGMQINTVSTFYKVSYNYILRITYCFKICSLPMRYWNYKHTVLIQEENEMFMV